MNNCIFFFKKYSKSHNILILPTVLRMNELIVFFLYSSLSLSLSLEYGRDPNVKLYIDCVLGGEKYASLNILTDFFKHAFDGDGDDGVSESTFFNWILDIIIVIL